MFVNKFVDGIERLSFDNGNFFLLCLILKVGLFVRISSFVGLLNIRERESDDEVDI